MFKGQQRYWVLIYQGVMYIYKDAKDSYVVTFPVKETHIVDGQLVWEKVPRCSNGERGTLRGEGRRQGRQEVMRVSSIPEPASSARDLGWGRDN